MSVMSVLNLFTPTLIWAGKFLFITAVTFWAASGWMFAFLLKYQGDSMTADLNHITSLMLRKGRRFIRSFGAASSILAIALMVEVYRQNSFSFTYLSFSVSAIVTVVSYLLIAEFFLVPALTRYEYLNRYISEKSVKDLPVHSIALNLYIRRLCYYQLFPALFVILTVSFQYSIY